MVNRRGGRDDVGSGLTRQFHARAGRIGGMIAFEISVNGHHVQTIAVGESGMLNVDVTWSRLQKYGATVLEEFLLWPTGLEGYSGDTLQWIRSRLKVGDSVTVKIVEVDGLADPPSERMRSENSNSERAGL